MYLSTKDIDLNQPYRPNTGQNLHSIKMDIQNKGEKYYAVLVFLSIILCSIGFTIHRTQKRVGINPKKRQPLSISILFCPSRDNEEVTWPWLTKPRWMNPYSLKNLKSLELRNIENMTGSQLPSEELMIFLWLEFQKWLCLVMISAVSDLGVSGFECNLTDLLSA